MLAYPIRAEDNLAEVSVHDCERTGPAAVDESAVNDDSEDVREISRPRRRTIQPVSDDLLDLPRAVPTLRRELSDGISLDEPVEEPGALSIEGIRGIAPDERATAGPAAQPTCSGNGRSPPLNVPSRTVRTSFFSPYC